MSLARRMWWVAVLLVLFASLSTGLVGWWAARALLLAEIDNHLVQDSRRMARYSPRSLPARAILSQRREGLEWRFIHADGRVGRSSEGWPETPIPSQLPTGAIQSLHSGERSWRIVQQAFKEEEEEEEGEQPGRGAVRRRMPAGAQRAWERRREQGALAQEDWLSGSSLQVLVEVTEIQADLRRLIVLLLMVSGLIGLLALLLAGRLRDAFLAPLGRLQAAIRGIAEDDLGARLHLKSLPAELEDLRWHMDELLSRLNQTRRRERRTIADIAHELRTPLAVLRSDLFFAAGDIPEASLQRLNQQTALLQQRFESILLLTRLDAGALQVQCQAISLAELCGESWAALAQEAAGRRIEFVVCERDCDILADPSLAQILFANILSNACDHALPDTSIHLSMDEEGPLARIVLSNAIAPAPPGPLPMAFEAFWRADENRSHSAQHCGLGLAIVAQIASLHKAQVCAEIAADGRRFVLSLLWPRACDSQPSLP